ncbi:MAG: Flp pilus assembly complex ATPase component TadA [Candidatus Omnitrophica bacterium]|nr:Flp pilus assembly complex ATPase component TadA [Candidatus Omnitrophota bacterium]
MEKENKQLKDPLIKDLVSQGLITQEQAVTLDIEKERSRSTLAEALRGLGLIDEESLVGFLSRKLHIEVFSLEDFVPDKDALSLLPSGFAAKYRIAPLQKEGEVLKVGFADPFRREPIEELRFHTGLFIKPYLVAKDSLDAFIETFCASEDKTGVEEVKSQDDKPSVIKLVDLLIAEAVNSRASDIHIEPKKNEVSIRFRIDGVLQLFKAPPRYLYSAIVARLKIMANLDIAERRKPQDGGFQVQVSARPIDVRVSVIPLVEGESIVLRLLEREKGVFTLGELGFSKENLEKYRHFLKQTSGIVLVTGPTGSGKSTTLYASLLEIKSVQKNIITIEDPVEYHLDFAKQIQVNPGVGLGFSQGLRSILRHDPDIVMVGEIRDLETAEIAIQAALTGHLVLSTLHTNDASSAVTRLIDMGLEPFLVASSLKGVIAQRLVRVLCDECRQQKDMSLADLEKALGFAISFSDKEIKVFQPQGCQRCNRTGFRGRVAIFEVLELDSTFDNLIVNKASSDEIRSHAQLRGFQTLRQDGFAKIIEGKTSVQEVLRVLGE